MEKQEKTMEEAFASLDGMVRKLEDPGISLEESFQVYKEGMELLKFCSQKIDTVEKSMQLLGEDGELSEF